MSRLVSASSLAYFVGTLDPSRIASVAKDDRIHRGEHAAQIEYPLLQLALDCPFKIVPLIMGGFGTDQMGSNARKKIHRHSRPVRDTDSSKAAKPATDK